MSILTSGSSVTKNCGFFHNIHCDFNDCAHGEFQETSIEYLKELMYKSDIEQDPVKGIEYLRHLSKCCKGFVTPTTCCCTILEKNAEDKRKSSSMHIFI